MARRSARRQKDRARSGRQRSPDRAHIADVIDSAAFGTLCVKLALVTLIFDPTADTPFVVPKVLASHALAYVLSGLLVGKALTAGRESFHWSWLHVAVVAFVTVNGLAAIFGVDHTLALFGTHNRMLGLGTVIDLAITYLAVASLVRGRARATVAVATVLGSSVLVLLYEALQLLGRDSFNWNIAGAISPFSTLGQPTTLAYYLTTLATALAALAIVATQLRPTLRVAAAGYAVLLLAGAVATGTRSIVLGLAAGGGLLWLVLLLRQSPGRAPLVVGGVGVVMAIAVAVGVAVTPLGARIAATLETSATSEGSDELLNRFDPSTAGRIALYWIAFEMLGERPLLGYGPDSFAAGMPAFRPAGAPTELRQSVVSSAHGWLPQIAATSGLLGVGTYLATIGVAFALALRTQTDPVLAVLGVALGGHLATGLTTVNEVTTDTLTWTILGLIAAGTTAKRAQNRHRSRPSLGSAVFAVGLVIVAALAAVSAFPAFNASRAARFSQDARLVGRVPEAIDAGLRATASDPGRAEYWRRLALAYVAASRWRDAIAAFEHAVSLAPYDVRNIGDLIAAQAASGDQSYRSSFPEMAERMVRVDPNNPYAQLTKATAMQFVGRQDDAVIAVKRALDLDPGSTNVQLYVAAAQILLASGRAADAERAAAEGIATVDRVEITLRAIPIRYEHARALASLGRISDALTELDLVLALQPSHAAAEQLRTQLRGVR